MEFALILLLITSISFVGLVSLWAATSCVHWFWRAAALTALFVLLAQLRSSEPLTFFTVQSLSILLPLHGIETWKKRQFRRESRSPELLDSSDRTMWRFSLRDVLLTTPIIAGFASTVPLLLKPRNDVDQATLTFALCGGIAFGLMTVLANWSVRGRLRFIASLSAVLPIAGVVGYGFEALDPGFLMFVLAGANDDNTLFWPWNVWAVVILGAWWMVAAVCFSQSQVLRSSAPNRWRWSGVVMAIAVFLLPTYVYYRLLTPLPIPAVVLPTPNGFNDIVAAGKGLNVRLINLADESPVDQVVAEVKRLDDYFKLAEQGLSRPCLVPLDYTDMSVGIDYFSECRTLCRAFSAKINSAVTEGRIEDAVRDIELSFQLGHACRSGGVVMHFLVGKAIEGVATSDLWNARESLDYGQCVHLIKVLQRHSDSEEPLDAMLDRDRLWTENAYGFYGQLAEILSDIGEKPWIERRLRTSIEPRYRSTIELLKCELAIRAFKLTHGWLPDSLQMLVPEVLPAVPVDPFDSTGGPLHYRVTDEGYDLYSVGLNGVDDRGIAIKDEEDSHPSSLGDFRLNAEYAPR
jgi:hypothetical protein